MRSCPMCAKNHRLTQCPHLLRLGPSQRIKFVLKNDCCLCCFSATHKVAQCQSPERCKICGEQHNTLIHRETVPQLSLETNHWPQQPTSLVSSMPVLRNASRSPPVFKQRWESPQSETDSCPMCGSRHRLTRCRRFRRIDLEEKLEFLRMKNRCFSCLSSSHGLLQCPSDLSCKICGSSHNTLIHQQPSSAAPHSNMPRRASRSPHLNIRRRSSRSPRSNVPRRVSRSPRSNMPRRASGSPRSNMLRRDNRSPRSNMPRKVSRSPRSNMLRRVSRSPRSNMLRRDNRSPRSNMLRRDNRSPRSNMLRRDNRSPLSNMLRRVSRSPHSNMIRRASRSPQLNIWRRSSRSPTPDKLRRASRSPPIFKQRWESLSPQPPARNVTRRRSPTSPRRPTHSDHARSQPERDNRRRPRSPQLTTRRVSRSRSPISKTHPRSVSRRRPETERHIRWQSPVTTYRRLSPMAQSHKRQSPERSHHSNRSAHQRRSRSPVNGIHNGRRSISPFGRRQDPTTPYAPIIEGVRERLNQLIAEVREATIRFR